MTFRTTKYDTKQVHPITAVDTMIPKATEALAQNT
jgi:hypothetical protein